jgi:alkaline phosphatase D
VITRRAFLGGVAATGALAACSGGSGTSAGPTTTHLAAPRLSGYPFTLGVASGDPTAEAVVLWTRLAPDALTVGGGMPTQDVPVRWEVANDERFADLVLDGTAMARADAGHTVHVDAVGLDPGRDFFYRFLLGDDESPTGRAITMPAAGDVPDRFLLGQVSCAQWGDGYYAAYRDLADSGVDLVVCLGDYIYERGAGTRADGAARDGQIVAETLDDYRHLYALYRSDEDLRAAHEAAPWAVIWDDHETSNDYVGDHPDADSESRTVEEFAARRAAAYRAWWEHMPVRFDPPTGPDLTIHRGLDIGALARLHLLDTRQYRTPLECPDAVGQIGARCDTSYDPDTTFLGADQEAWVADSLSGGDDRVWDIVGNQVILHQWRFGPGRDAIFNLDQWDGYPEARSRMADALAGAAGDVVVLTGDVHSTWVADLKADYDDEGSERIGTELVTPGVSSEGSDIAVIEDVIRTNSPHVRYSEALHRGWLRHELTAQAWTAEIRHVEEFADRASPVPTSASFVIEPGQPIAEA